MAAEQRAFVTNSRRYVLLSLSMQGEYGKRSSTTLGAFTRRDSPQSPLCGLHLRWAPGLPLQTASSFPVRHLAPLPGCCRRDARLGDQNTGEKLVARLLTRTGETWQNRRDILTHSDRTSLAGSTSPVAKRHVISSPSMFRTENSRPLPRWTVATESGIFLRALRKTHVPSFFLVRTEAAGWRPTPSPKHRAWCKRAPRIRSVGLAGDRETLVSSGDRSSSPLSLSLSPRLTFDLAEIHSLPSELARERERASAETLRPAHIHQPPSLPTIDPLRGLVSRPP